MVDRLLLSLFLLTLAVAARPAQAAAPVIVESRGRIICYAYVEGPEAGGWDAVLLGDLNRLQPLHELPMEASR